jgi:ubiquinone/menaquinone biosynthesis C-methylase UbiE
MKREMMNEPSITAADIGCGAGTYTLELFQYLGLENRLFLYCIDPSAAMLKQLSDHLTHHGIRRFKAIRACAVHLPFPAAALDCVMTFNAIHHFPISAFFKEAGRILKNMGRVFVYSRLRSQNRQSIWGQHFPFFAERETRLYEMNELAGALDETQDLRLHKAKVFKRKRKSSLRSLIEQARNHHYSTFCLYNRREFAEALREFENRIRHHFSDMNALEWTDENVLLVVKKYTS